MHIKNPSNLVIVHVVWHELYISYEHVRKLVNLHCSFIVASELSVIYAIDPYHVILWPTNIYENIRILLAMGDLVMLELVRLLIHVFTEDLLYHGQSYDYSPVWSSLRLSPITV